MQFRLQTCRWQLNRGIRIVVNLLVVVAAAVFPSIYDMFFERNLLVRMMMMMIPSFTKLMCLFDALFVSMNFASTPPALLLGT